MLGWLSGRDNSKGIGSVTKMRTKNNNKLLIWIFWMERRGIHLSQTTVERIGVLVNATLMILDALGDQLTIMRMESKLEESGSPWSSVLIKDPKK